MMMTMTKMRMKKKVREGVGVVTNPVYLPNRFLDSKFSRGLLKGDQYLFMELEPRLVDLLTREGASAYRIIWDSHEMNQATIPDPSTQWKE